MTNIIKYLFDENNKPCEKTDKRRNRKFFEKTLLYYYYKSNVPNNLLNNEFWMEHIFPFSCAWNNEIDIDRLGNVIPIIDELNSKRKDKHISEYKKYDKNNFISFIKKIIPSEDVYNSIINHNTRKPNIINNKEYNKLCEKNEEEYLNNFLKCIY
jgi:hypothetical protein